MKKKKTNDFLLLGKWLGLKLDHLHHHSPDNKENNEKKKKKKNKEKSTKINNNLKPNLMDSKTIQK